MLLLFSPVPRGQSLSAQQQTRDNTLQWTQSKQDWALKPERRLSANLEQTTLFVPQVIFVGQGWYALSMQKGLWGWTGTVITSSFPSFCVNNKCSLGSCQSTTPLQGDKFHMKYSPAYYLLNLDNYESAFHIVLGFPPPSLQEKKTRKASAGSNTIISQSSVSGQRVLGKEREQELFARDCQGAISSGPPEQQADQRLWGKATRVVSTSHWEKNISYILNVNLKKC